MLKLHIVVAPNEFFIETDAPLAEVVPLVDKWFAAIAVPKPVIHGTLVFGQPTPQPVP